MKLFRLKKIIQGGIILLFFVMPFIAQAIEIQNYDNMPVEGDFVLGPGKIELFLDPGESITRDLKITNRTGRMLTINIDIEDFTGDPNYSTQLLGDEQGPYSLRDYIKPEISEFNLSHGERASLPVTISIPEDASPGGLYGATIARVSPASEQEEKIADGATGNVGIVSRLATLFFVRVKGDINESGYLKSFTTDKKFYKQGPVNFSIVYENTGSVHLNPYATIEIKNITGKKIDTVDVAPYFVMPGFIRNRSVDWHKKLAFGRYTAIASVNRGYNNLVDEAKITFWIIPLKVIIISLSVILLLAVLIWWFSSKFEVKRKQ